MEYKSDTTELLYKIESQTYRTNIWLLKGGVQEYLRSLRITLLYLKSLTNKYIQHITGNSAKYYVKTKWENNFKTNRYM